MRVGVHCSVRGGFDAAAREAAALGCDTLQIFTQSPRGWMTRVFQDSEFSAFRKEREKLGLYPVVVHTPYLPNLCTSLDSMYQRSLRALKDDLQRCEKLEADYLVVHPGAYSPEANVTEGLRRLISALNEGLAAVPGHCQILLENMAGGGRRIGGKFEEIAEILASVKDKNRVGVCFDTCHAFAAGHDLSQAKGVEQTFQDFDKTIGLEHIKVFHVNDSKKEIGSRRDLHQHIGQGYIGKMGFKEIFKNPAFQDCALILETPKEPMPQSDLANLKTLRSLLP